MRTPTFRIICLTFLIPLVCALFAAQALAFECKVMVVMSYEENLPWVKDLREGIEPVLSACEYRFAYLDTRTNPAGGAQKAKEALELYRQWMPDGIIACDDEAQSLFVVPYLRDQVKTPVMFCGVNAEPEKYAYPATNVSGILERPYITESISLLRQISPQIQTIAFILRETPTAHLIEEQIKKEASTYPAAVLEFRTAADITEANRLAIQFSVDADALFIDDMEGLPDEKGHPMAEKAVTQLLSRIFSKPTLGIKSATLGYGLLGGVIIRGQEQGRSAAIMLRDTMEAKPVAQIPMVRNSAGKRVLNLTTLKALGLSPEPLMLRGIELIRTKGLAP